MQSSSPILKAAMQVNVNLHASGKRVWFSILQRCLKFCGKDHILYTSDPVEIAYTVRRLKYTLQGKASSHWKDARNNMRANEKSKLNLFAHVKDDCTFENYLTTCADPKSRRALCKYRISSHNLPVEIHRYVEIDREDRLCPFCVRDIGNEQHYLVECADPTFTTQRAPLFSYVLGKFPDFEKLNPIQKTAFLLSSKDPSVNAKVGKYCLYITETFKLCNTRTM